MYRQISKCTDKTPLVHMHIYMQFPFITYGMALCINDSAPTKQSNIFVKIYVYMRASGVSELRKFWQFYIIKVLFLSIWMGRYIL